MSRVIDKNQGSDCPRWDAPELKGGPASGRTPVRGQGRSGQMGLMTVSQTEELQSRAYEEGFALGQKEGRVAGQQALAEQASRLGELMRALTRPFEELDDEVEQGLVTLAMAIANQLVRREIRADHGQIVAVVHEAVGMLPSSSRTVQLRLHPEDAALVRELIPMPDGENLWRVIEDPTIGRGGCLAFTETSLVDATLDARMKAVTAALIGGEREEDRQ